MGHAHKLFGFSISYTVLNIPLSILYLPIMLLNPCNFIPNLPLPTDNPPTDLYIYFSASVLLVFLVLFLESIVDSHKCIATFYLMLKKVLREYYSK